MDATPDAKVEQFCSVTGADAAAARYFIDLVGGRVSAAVDAFFEAGAVVPHGASSPEPASAPASAPAPAPAPSTAGSGTRARVPGSRVMGFSEMGGGGDGDGPEDGGDDGGGDLAAGVVRAARARAGTGNPSGSAAGGKAEEEEAGRVKEVPITLWKDGFVVGEYGEFRSYSEPKNKVFIQTIQAGGMPPEFRELSGRGAVDVRLKDKRGEKYVEPPDAGWKRAQAEAAKKEAGTATATATGGGVAAVPRRAGVAAGTTGAATATAASGGVDSGVAADVKPTPPEVAVDADAPTTTLMVIFANGQKLRQDFNTTTTIGQLRAFVQASLPGVFGLWKMTGGMPARDLEDDAQTLEEAKLKRAKITQVMVDMS